MASKIRVLVVDDSPLLRCIITDVLNAQTDLEVVGTAEDGKQGVAMAQQLKPDVVTLDIQMPHMNGLQTLEAILTKTPIPIVMVSSLTKFGANATLDALERGAIDFLTKPEGSAQLAGPFATELIKKIRLAAGADIVRRLELRRQRAAARRSMQCAPAVNAAHLASKLIAIGISTGGPPALSQLLPALHAPLPPIVIVQHMPPTFTKAFAHRLDSLCSLTVKEGEQGDVLQQNHVYIAPGGFHLEIFKTVHAFKLVVSSGDHVSGHKPSVDVLMHSAVKAYGSNILGVIMTGMGSDGVAGCQAIRASQGYVYGQDQPSSDVYGMNKAAMLAGAVDEQFDLADGASLIQHYALTWKPRLLLARSK